MEVLENVSCLLYALMHFDVLKNMKKIHNANNVLHASIMPQNFKSELDVQLEKQKHEYDSLMFIMGLFHFQFV